MSGLIGILCGLKSEARIADRLPNVLVGCSAADPERAQSLAYHMVEKGVSRLISFGLAGATSPDLCAGDLVIGATVLTTGQSWEADPEWNDDLLHHLDCFTCAPVWGSKRIVSTVAEKQAIYQRAGCWLVDMESQIVAQVASRARLPFNVVRAVADTAGMALPPAARVKLKPDGSVNLRGVYDSIVNQPSQLLKLLPLGHNTSLALRALKRAVSVMREIEDERVRL